MSHLETYTTPPACARSTIRIQPVPWDPAWKVQRRVASELSRRSVSDVAARNSPKHSSATLQHLIMSGANEEAYKFPNSATTAAGPPALSTGEPAVALRRPGPPAISTGSTPIVSRRGSDEATPTQKATAVPGAV